MRPMVLWRVGGRVSRIGMLSALGSLVLLASAGTGSAATVSGPWAPFANCPVDDPALLAAPANTFGTLCVASDSPSGTFTIGKTTVPTGETNLQFGVSGAEAGNPSLGQIVPAAPGKTLVADPAQIPGGLLGLMCPASNILVRQLCASITNSSLNTVTATTELAGPPSDFSALGGLTTGHPIVSLPIKIHLQNPLLGSHCSLGSNTAPIVLHPETTTVGSGSGVADPNGFPVAFITISGSVLGDDSFAVPGTSGCGGVLLAPLVDAAINAKLGLPSPAGKNSIVLNDATEALALTPQGGQVLRDAWEASCTAGC